MSHSFLLSLIAILSLVFLSNCEVTQWTESEFVSKLNDGDSFVMFYAPWCGHCQRLHPTFETVSGGPNVNIAQVDCTQNAVMCQKLGVRGYPTLLYFHNNKVYKYSGERTKEAFEAFINEGWTEAEAQNVPDLTVEEKEASVEDVEDVEASQESKVLTLTQSNITLLSTTGGKFVLEFYAPWCGFCKRYADTYEDIARKVKYNVAKINCDEEKNLCRVFGIQGFPTLKLVENGKVYDIPNRDVDPLIEFVETKKSEDEGTELPAFDVFSTILRELTAGFNEINTDWEELMKYKKGIISVVVAVTAVIASAVTSFACVCCFCVCGGSSNGKQRKNKEE